MSSFAADADHGADTDRSVEIRLAGRWEEISSINLIDTRDETGWTGTAQAGSSSPITLAAGFDNAGIEMRGRYVHNTTAAVTGKGQILTYDNTTKVGRSDDCGRNSIRGATPYMIEAMRWEVKKRTSYHMNAWEQSYELTRLKQMIMRGRTGVFDCAGSRTSWSGSTTAQTGGTMQARCSPASPRNGARCTSRASVFE